MDLQFVKSKSIQYGCYRPLRAFYNHVLKPSRARDIRRATKLYSQFVDRGDLCFDIGANLGNRVQSLLALKGTVIAVEPHPRCVEELRARFGNDPAFHCVAKAVGREPGRATFHLAAASQQSSLRQDWIDQWVSSIDVEVTTLDSLIEEFGIPKFCKIDVEGCELEVLGGLSRPIDVISFEYHAQQGDIERTIGCLKYLRGLGRFRVNVSPMETLELLSETWWDDEAFLDVFLNDLIPNPEYFYGDIFVSFHGRAD
jgi:FkbM family methyltransferase